MAEGVLWRGVDGPSRSGWLGGVGLHPGKAVRARVDSRRRLVRCGGGVAWEERPRVVGQPAMRLGWGRQSLLAGLLWLLAVAFTALVAPSSGSYFERFYGPARPLVVMVGVGVVGTAAFWVLSRFGFVFVEGLRTLRGLRLSAIFATVLAIAVVVAMCSCAIRRTSTFRCLERCSSIRRSA